MTRSQETASSTALAEMSLIHSQIEESKAVLRSSLRRFLFRTLGFGMLVTRDTAKERCPISRVGWNPGSIREKRKWVQR
jgi:hypothetical protein